MADFNAIRMDFGGSMQKAEAVRLKPNISRDNDLSIFGHGALPHRPTKGLSVFDCLFLPPAATTENPFGNLRAQILLFSFSLKYRVYPLDNLRLFYLFCLPYPICVMSFCSLFRIRFSSLEI